MNIDYCIVNIALGDLQHSALKLNKFDWHLYQQITRQRGLNREHISDAEKLQSNHALRQYALQG